MPKKIYVGNLNYATAEEALERLFAQYGEVVSVAVIKDRLTEQSKGFGFVEMAEEDSADAAIATLNGKELDGRRIRVNPAEDKPRRARSGFAREGGYGSDGGYVRDGGYNRESGYGRDSGYKRDGDYSRAGGYKRERGGYRGYGYNQNGGDYRY